MFPLLAWFFAVILVKFYDNCENKAVSNGLIAIALGAVLVAAISGDRIIYSFDYGKDITQYVNEQGFESMVVNSPAGEGGVNNNTLYQAAVLVDERTQYMAVENLEAIKDSLPDSFLFVTRDYQDNVEDYLNLGYIIQWESSASVYRYYHLVK